MEQIRTAGGQFKPRGRKVGWRAAVLFLFASFAGPAIPSTMPVIPAAAVIRATPALWEVRDSDTRIYLFGTFHTLDGRTVWFDHRVREAFNGSDELMLETIVPASREAIAEAGRQVTEVGANGAPTLKPFIAQTRTVVNQGRSMGLSVEFGADTVLRRIAEGSGKPVGGLERFEDQLGQLARIPSAAPARDQATEVTVTLNDLLAAWSSGDSGAFSAMLAGFEARSPAAYRILIAERNARWGQWIADRLERPGTVFVAVGSGHLAGKDSVQQWLASRGITAARVG